MEKLHSSEAATTVLLLPHQHRVVHEKMHITNATGLSHSLTQLTSPQHSTQQVQACVSTRPLPANNPSPATTTHNPALPWECYRLDQGAAAQHTRLKAPLKQAAGLASPCAATHQATYREHTSTASQLSLRAQPNIANTANLHNCTEDIVVVHDYAAKARANTQQAPHDERH